MLRKFSSITRGTVYISIVRYCKKSQVDKTLLDLEKTRYRKKPAGGSRHLNDPKNIYLFNAWYYYFSYNFIHNFGKLLLFTRNLLDKWIKVKQDSGTRFD